VNKGLVQRWIDAVKPFDLDESISAMSVQYGNAMSWDGPTIERAKKAITSISKQALTENLRMFAEENFSEESLQAGVEFFESPLGVKYLAQRDVVMKGSQFLITKLIAEGIKKEFGI
jgi:hypothetical protein